MTLTKLEQAVKDREATANTINWLQKKISAHHTTPLTSVEVDHYLGQLDSQQKEVVDHHKKIVSCSPSDLDPHLQEYYRLLDELSKLQCYLKAVRARSRTSTTPSTTTPTSSQPDIRLPRMELPCFDGVIANWIPYRDMFNAAICNNTTLSGVQKLTYLKSSLSGEAARLVRSLPITDANFSIAWKLLEERYHNERELIFSILRRFTGQPQLQSTTAVALRSLVDTTKECTRSLETLSVPVNQWDTIIVFLIHQKLDPSSRELWEQTLTDKKVPALQKFLEFLEQRASAIAAGSVQRSRPSSQQADGGNRRHANHTQTDTDICKLCSGDHMLHKCTKFLNFATHERINYIKQQNRCHNCLRHGHPTGSCPSKYTCRICKELHHTLLHKPKPVDKPAQPPANPQQPSSQKPGPSGSSENYFSNGDNVISKSILATVIMKVSDNYGGTQVCRAFLDSGSESTFISESCIRRLGLKRQQTSVTITGLGGTTVGTVKGSVTLTIFPHFDNTSSFIVNSLVANKVTNKLPSFECDPTVWPHINGLQLADPEFHKPADVDILLGSDVYFEILRDGLRHGPPNSPVAVKTALGWLVGGRVSQVAMQPITVNHYIETDLNNTLEKFWTIESVPEATPHTEEEALCEKHYEDNFVRDQNGRFTVKLPVRTPPVPLGQSRDIAIRRLKAMERRLAKEPQYKQDYKEFMDEYKNLGHMREISSLNLQTQRHCYIPHHYVLKEASTTTKFRVVFDASAKTTSGNSLNDSLLVGPTIQDTLTDILMRFRTHPVAFTADIAKMYRQIKVAEEDVSMQRIVWRENPTDSIKDYELLTVTYGTGPAPYLATKSLQKLAELEKDTSPRASKIMTEDFYVDDCMSGAPDVQAAIEIRLELNTTLDRGGFPLRKWASNSPELLASIPLQQRELQDVNMITDDHTIKTLGINWNPSADQFMFKVNVDTNILDKITKRIALSEIAKLFDPLGWLQPVIIVGKIAMQQLWRLECHWDDVLPNDLQSSWCTFFHDLQKLEDIKIPRHINPHHGTTFELIGFSDASLRAYSAVVYIKSISPSGESHVALITAKTRVAPAKTITLPRLELCGALLLSSLMVNVIKAHKYHSFENIYAFTDSTITLAWIHAHPSKWKTFVQNRVAKIQSNIPAKHWRHVAGKENPADCASRGISATELVNHPLWWTGPTWLTTERVHPICEPPTTDIDLQPRTEVSTPTEVSESSLPILKYSSLTKLKRVTGWVLRFIHNARTHNKDERRKGNLSAEELESSLSLLVRTVQQQAFGLECAALKRKLEFPNKSKLKTLTPFLDAQQCMRVGGRLNKADISQDRKHPYVLPRHHHFTYILIWETHIKNCHAGPQLMQSILQQQWWILRIKDAIRFSIKQCIPCTRHAAKTAQQMMGALPAVRVNPSRPFSKVGVDLAGPILIKPMVRSKVTLKVYISIFICMCTRAIHIDIVSALSTSAFLACLDRFMSKRGKPTDIYSDQGTNFIGCARVLKENHSAFSNNEIHSRLAADGITWHFNPPSSPHFGGLWEAGVKSIKFHLFRVIGNTRLTYDELETVLCKIESVLNSRPLTPFSTDPSDLSALTPGHFLIGAPLTAPPEANLLSTPTNRLQRWEVVRQMQQGFWRRWSNEFITRLQQRPKWLGPERNIQQNDMVILKDDRLPPLHWKLGRVLKCHPGADGLTRVVTLRTSDGTLQRPVVKLCLLPVDTS